MCSEDRENGEPFSPKSPRKSNGGSAGFKTEWFSAWLNSRTRDVGRAPDENCWKPRDICLKSLYRSGEGFASLQGESSRKVSIPIGLIIGLIPFPRRLCPDCRLRYQVPRSRLTRRLKSGLMNRRLSQWFFATRRSKSTAKKLRLLLLDAPQICFRFSD